MSGPSIIVAGLLSLVAIVAAVELAARWWLRREGLYYVFPPGQRLRLHVDRENFPELESIVRFDVNRDDLLDVFEAQIVEANDFVNSIQKLRAEMPL